MKASTQTKTLVPPKRCAIYTRKSSEEGLEQEYNSLDAQRDAGLSFIASQRHEGWVMVADGYDDGGYSGGNMDRPALTRLLADIAARRIDVIVVYKIDRLSRSLADFAKMVELFDAHGVTFVSVTQQFNTTTSMGRLTLNILLSFAQFEREVTGERIRDKIAASKAKGMWMGGVPPLGYDVSQRKLVVNPTEAELVRDIFKRYAEHGSAARLVRELAVEGHTTKAWVTQTGKLRVGRVIEQPYLFQMLRNRLYLGEMVHKGQTFPGQHDAIVSTSLWDAVHAIVEQRKQGPRQRHTDSPALLAGLLFSADGQRMLPTFTQKKNGKRYHYYVPCLDKRRGANSNITRPIPSAEIESAVLHEVFKALRQPEMLVATWKATQAMQGATNLEEGQVVIAIQQMATVWQQLFPAEQHRILRLLVTRVQFKNQEGLNITWADHGWRAFAQKLEAQPLMQEIREEQEIHEDQEVLV